MTFTYQAVVDLARVPLNDADKTRYSDNTLLSYTNAAIHELVKHRPDLFIGQYGSLPTGQANLEDVCPIDAGYAMTLANYVTGRALMIDDEHTNTGKAGVFMQLLNGDI